MDARRGLGRTGVRHLQEVSIMQRTLVGFTLTFLTFGFVSGDVIWKEDGSKVAGTILDEQADRVLMLVKMGTMEAKVWIPRAEIFKIERGALPEDEFRDRLAGLDPADLKGHQTLLAWARERKLLDEAELLEQRLADVEWKHRKKSNPRRWCRSCDARGKRACAECAGAGELLDPCGRCEGRGELACERCEHQDERGTLRCRKCSGAGSIERFDPEKGRKETRRCPSCRGSGHVECPECQGERARPCPLCKGAAGVKRVCPACSGKPFELCRTCSGSGLQPSPVSDEQLAREEAEAQDRKKKPDSPPKPESRPKSGTGPKPGGG